MLPIKGLVVCVNFGDLLAITLPRNARHLTEVLVVSHPDDAETAEVVKSVPNARLSLTDAFFLHNAHFNKGLAIEEAGFDVLGRDGWIAVIDADTLLPDSFDVSGLKADTLHSAPRRILDDPRRWNTALDWRTCQLSRDIVYPGYFHLFHGSDPHLADRPWYDCCFKHAGGGDGYFQSRWPKSHKLRLPFDVLHLGPRDTNWFGRVSGRTDGKLIVEAGKRQVEMRRFRESEGKRIKAQRSTANRSHSCIWLDPAYDERVVVPGHCPQVWKHGRDE